METSREQLHQNSPVPVLLDSEEGCISVTELIIVMKLVVFFFFLILMWLLVT